MNLRLRYLEEILETQPEVAFWEIIAENLFDNPEALSKVQEISQRTPTSLHCVGMNLGGLDPISTDYLKKVKHIREEIHAMHVSDHMCFQKHANVHHHDLLPIPLNEAHLASCISRVKQVQDFLGEAILIENLSFYVEYNSSDIPEAEFIQRVCEATGAKMILDLNNIEVNQTNLGFNKEDHLNALEWSLIGEVHLAGPETIDGIQVDTHGSEPSDQSLHFLQNNKEFFSELPVCYERDNHIPALADSLAVVRKIEKALS